MHLSAKRPIFVPEEHCEEIEKLSKAALMDLVWDLATTSTTVDTMDFIRERAKIVLHHRKLSAKSWHPKRPGGIRRETS